MYVARPGGQELINFSADGRSQLLSVDAQRVVRMWDVGRCYTDEDGTGSASRTSGPAFRQRYHPYGVGFKGREGVGKKVPPRDFLPDIGGTSVSGDAYGALRLVMRYDSRAERVSSASAARIGFGQYRYDPRKSS